MSVVADWAAIAMFVVFAVAFVAKARSAQAFDDFAASLSQFGISSISGQRLTAAAVLLLEVLASLGLLLIHSPLARFALPVALLAVFGAGIAFSSRGGRVSACHCFGTSTELPTSPHLALNGSLAALGCVAAFSGDPAGSAGETVLGVGLGIITGVLFVCAADLYSALSTAGQPAGRGSIAGKVG